MAQPSCPPCLSPLTCPRGVELEANLARGFSTLGVEVPTATCKLCPQSPLTLAPVTGVRAGAQGPAAALLHTE